MRKMKNLTAIILSAMIATSTSAMAANNDTWETWYVNANSGLNCRQTPEIKEGNILCAYPKGTELQIIGVDSTGEWWETWDGKTQGWCYSTYLTDNKEKAEQKVNASTNQNISATGSVGTYLGNFYVTGYTPDPAENGGYGVTCMGDDLWSSVGWAIAVDPNVIPLGTKVYIEGIGYRTARDTGGAIKGNIIDVLTGSNAESSNITGHYNVYLAE